MPSWPTWKKTSQNGETMSSSGDARPVGFAGALTITFVVLKLTGVIDWSWVWVLSPVWIPLVIALALLALFLFAAVVAGLVDLLGALRKSRTGQRRSPTSDPRDGALHGPVRKWGYRPVSIEQIRARGRARPAEPDGEEHP